MAKYKLRLSGPAARGTRVSATLLRDLLGVLVDGAQQSLRLRVEGTSIVQGKLPAWLKRASTFDIIGIEAGSTLLTLEAPRLVDAAPEKFGQGQLFTPLDPTRTSVDLLAESLSHALANDQESEFYDDGLIQTFESLDQTLREDLETIEILDGLPVRVDKRSIDAFRLLRKSIPAEQQVVIAGRLDLLRHSDRYFTLVLSNGDRVRGVAVGHRIDNRSLAELWGKFARVSGTTKFRPSGSVLRVDADSIAPASDRDLLLWSALPRPLMRPLDDRSLMKAQGPRSGLASIFGRWPGDESDDEVIDALERLS